MSRRECVETKLDLMANNGHGKEYKKEEKEEDKQLFRLSFTVYRMVTITKKLVD